MESRGMGSSWAKTEDPRPHAVCVPFPAQGHITPMLKLAKLLHHRGFHITFVHSHFNHRRILNSQGPSALDGLPSFRFATIPDGLPPSPAADATQDIPALCDSTRKNCLGPLRELVAGLNNRRASPDVPPVSCIVSDGAMAFALRVAEEVGIPGVLFFTSSVCGFMGYSQYRPLVQKGLVPLKDASYLTNGYLDTAVDWTPGSKGISLKDIPSFIRTTDPNDIMVDFALEAVDTARRASAIIFNSFDALENDVLAALSKDFPPIFALGPLQLLLDQIVGKGNNYLNSIRPNLWKEEPDCLSWLDSKEPNSVVYVNFGSITVMTSEQLIEFAWGLSNSNQAFLWVIRPDLVKGENAILPMEFVNETKERSLLASWCPQEQVLGHPSIGVFLTHCGWNSTLESICSGVPMICWPFFSEQPTNCWFVCSQLGVGLEIDGDVRRDEVESQLREMMVGERGKEMKRKVMEWKKLAEDSTARSVGSSYNNFEKFVSSVLMASASSN